MYIAGRKKKRFSAKLSAEMTAYLLVRYEHAFFVQPFMEEFGVSLRSADRYIRDLERCGVVPVLHRDGREYTPGEDAEDPDLSAPLADDVHVRHLRRLIKIWELHSRPYYDAMYPDGGSHEDITTEPFAVSITASETLARMTEAGETPTDLRTVQRDLAVIADAMEHFRNILLW